MIGAKYWIILLWIFGDVHFSSFAQCVYCSDDITAIIA